MYSFKAEDNLYDWISCISKDKLYFGPFPNQLMIDKLIEEKFDFIVNLTMDDENIYNREEDREDYKLMYRVPKNKYMPYPIKDNDIPDSPISYCSLITRLKMLYDKDKKIYIHCRGGHGRSGMVSTSLLLAINQEKSIKDVIQEVNNSHINRVILREKWKNKNTPFNYTQYSFLLKIHKNIYININNKHYNWIIFNDCIDYKGKSFYNIYDFFVNKNIEDNEKSDFLKSYFINKVKYNRDIEYKLYLTYLRKIILTDCNDVDFCNLYANTLYDIRNSYFLEI